MLPLNLCSDSEDDPERTPKSIGDSSMWQGVVNCYNVSEVVHFLIKYERKFLSIVFSRLYRKIFSNKCYISYTVNIINIYL